jgi:prolyl-tRNA synthetase
MGFRVNCPLDCAPWNLRYCQRRRDDLDQRPGAKFATADLIGIPSQNLVGPSNLAEGKVEFKKRSDSSRELITPASAVERPAA